MSSELFCFLKLFDMVEEICAFVAISCNLGLLTFMQKFIIQKKIVSKIVGLFPGLRWSRRRHHTPFLLFKLI